MQYILHNARLGLQYTQYTQNICMKVLCHRLLLKLIITIKFTVYTHTHIEHLKWKFVQHICRKYIVIADKLPISWIILWIVYWYGYVICSSVQTPTSFTFIFPSCRWTMIIYKKNCKENIPRIYWSKKIISRVSIVE